MARVVRYIIAGMLGAVVAWIIMEPTSLMPDKEVSVSYTQTFIIGLIFGFIVGLMMGCAEAVSGLSPKDARKAILSGALVGAGGGILGLSFGQAVYNPLHAMAGRDITAGFFSFMLELVGRGFGWALIGGFVGLSQGIATGSPKKMVNGAIGGFLGGGIGGSTFQMMVFMNEAGAIAFRVEMIRFVAFSITGASIGLFIGFIEEVAKQAWLIRLVGRNEGKEYTLYKQVTTLGRSEVVDIPVFTDPDVAERHAAISVQGRQYFIEDLGSSFGTSVNGTKVTKQPLRDNDTISIGKTRFLFRDKMTARYSTSDSGSYSTGAKIPTSDRVCQFCGTIKDAAGNCDCSVGSAPAGGSTQMGMPPSQQTVQTPWAAQSPVPNQTLQQSAAAQGAKLIAMAGPYAGQTYVLGQVTEIGRDSTKTVSLSSDNTVSRNHAKVVREGAGYVLYDDGSTNGTYANNNRVTRHDLRNGDLVQIGSTRFRFEG